VTSFAVAFFPFLKVYPMSEELICLSLQQFQVTILDVETPASLTAVSCPCPTIKLPDYVCNEFIRLFGLPSAVTNAEAIDLKP
jgi:hypothetical protein